MLYLEIEVGFKGPSELLAAGIPNVLRKKKKDISLFVLLESSVDVQKAKKKKNPGWIF